MEGFNEDARSYAIKLSQYDTHGFCQDYPHRRHHYESLANAGCYEARRDWIQYIGPVSAFGNCNPINGNFTSVVLPLCKPERLKLVAYVLEYAFLHDNVVEGIEAKSDKQDGDEFEFGDMESAEAAVKAGRKQIQAKMMLQLSATDKTCAERIMKVWKTMLSTTLDEKARDFDSLEEYLDFRIVDIGAPFVESIMLFGMGLTLTEQEDECLAEIIRPCYASLALANDYFSFDREWEEAQEPGAPEPANAVWLYMRWQGVDIPTAKRLVREATNVYERRFLESCERFRRTSPYASAKLDLYLRSLSYQVSGNVVWSLNCPRYHPEFRYDPNAGLEDELTARLTARRCRTTLPFDEMDGPVATAPAHHRHSIVSVESSDGDSVWDAASSSSRSSSISVSSADEEAGEEASLKLPTIEQLNAEHLNAPFEYVHSMPSKGIRDTLIDALNLWAGMPEDTVAKVKGVVDHLHTASLLFDDIEDGSELRRGHPAAHAVFGVPQTINSASFAIVEAIAKAKELPIPGVLDITFEQLRQLHIGQSYDLYWTRHLKPPSEEEYLEMVSKKTGGLFRLLSKLMSSKMDAEPQRAVDELIMVLGIYFQIRDDYQNLNSDEYAAKKGLCEDLDEGKLSFPIVHYFSTTHSPESLRLREVMQTRQQRGGLSAPLKQLALEQLKASNSLAYTRETLKRLEGDIGHSIGRLESMTGQKNWVMRLALQKLSV